MNFKMMGRFIAQILSVEGLFMVPALIMALCLGETMALRGFLVALVVIVLTVYILHRICQGAPSAFFAKEGLVSSHTLRKL